MSIFRVITMPVAVVVGMAVAIIPAEPALAATWSVVTTPNASTGQNLFIGTDALSANNVWAVAAPTMHRSSRSSARSPPDGTAVPGRSSARLSWPGN